LAKVYHDQDIDMRILEDKLVAVIGYGSQGRAQSLNLRDSGVEVVVGLRHGGSWERAEKEGFRVLPISSAAEEADIIVMLIPDMAMPKVYRDEIEAKLEPGKTIQFAHGFNIHYGLIKPPVGVDVTMVAPKAPGPELRRQYEMGFGVPSLVAVHRTNAHSLSPR
jgi:ketol-acid reductoisomerase